MSDITRKLVTIRTIDAVGPIEGADAIEVATIGGWNVVIKKGELKAGDECVYFEIDSFLPDGNPAWQFLVDKSGRTFEGKLGHRLRTVKLRGQVSQGFIVPLDALPQLMAEVVKVQCNGRTSAEAANEDLDMAALLGIVKWEQPLPAELAGQAEGLFPSWMRKTDQERCQNLVNEIFQTTDVLVEFDVDHVSQEALNAMRAKMLIQEADGKTFKVSPAKAHPNDLYEITMKLDGSSCTFFHRDGEVGVCSRNLQLKVNEANAGNTFVRMLIDSRLDVALPQLGNIAIQGEIMGPAVQGNREQFKDFRFYIFDVQNLDTGMYYTASARRELVESLTAMGVDTLTKVFHVPTMSDGRMFTDRFRTGQRIAFTLYELGITNVKDLLAFAEGPSITHPVREGLVFKRTDGKFSFKAISNVFLAKEKD